MMTLNLLVLALVVAENVVIALLLYQWRRWAGYAFGLLWTLIGLAENPEREGVVWVGTLRELDAAPVLVSTVLLVIAWEVLRRVRSFGGGRDLIQRQRCDGDDPARVRRASLSWCASGLLVAGAGLLSAGWIGRDGSAMVMSAGGSALGFGIVFLYVWSGSGARDPDVRRRRAKWAILPIVGGILFVLLFLWFQINGSK